MGLPRDDGLRLTPDGQALVERHQVRAIRLGRFWANRFHAAEDDFIGAACLGLCRAAARFDGRIPELEFGAYARFSIFSAIRAELRELLSWRRARPLPDELRAIFDEDDPERAEVLWEAFYSLPEQEQDVLIGRVIYERTTREVAAELGISHMHVRRLERRALAKLRAVLTA